MKRKKEKKKDTKNTRLKGFRSWATLDKLGCGNYDKAPNNFSGNTENDKKKKNGFHQNNGSFHIVFQ